MLHDTVQSFSRAALPLKIMGGPIHAVDRGIFQLDINRGRTGEYFRVWPGAANNDFSVSDADPQFRQVVLLVRERRRRFEQWLPRERWTSQTRAEQFVEEHDGRILYETVRGWRVECWTPEHQRRYLCGFDERALFIAEVRDGATVREAHRSLLPDALRDAPPAVRQGEWFFVAAEDGLLRSLSSYAATHPRSLRHREPLGPGRHPHVADLVLRLDRRERRGRREIRHPEIYACGQVTHVDHRAVVLAGWHQAVRNREVQPAAGAGARMKWID